MRLKAMLIKIMHAYQQLVQKFGEQKVVPVCARIASELAQLSDS